MSVLGMMSWHVWEIRRIRRKPKSVLVEGLLTWEDTGGQNSVTTSNQRMKAP